MKHMNTKLLGAVCLGTRLAIASQAFAQTPVELVAHYRLDGNADDSSENGNNGVLVGSPTQVNGVVDQAYFFDGSDDRISLSGTFLGAGLPRGTISCWIRVDSFDSIFGRVIFNRGIAALHTALIFGVGGDGRLTTSMNRQTAPLSIGSVPLNAFAHVAVTWDGSRVKYYIQGEPSGDFPFTGTPEPGGAMTVDIGRDDQDVGYFHGVIDDLRIYSRDLLTAEVFELAQPPDTSPPTISCPENFVVPAEPAKCSAIVTYTVVAEDDRSDVTVVCEPPPESEFPLGITTVVCIATDAAGNMATCSFSVTVRDAEPPTIICPADIALGCSIDLLVPALFTVSAYDNCDAQPTVICNPASGSGFPVGVTTVTATATDEAGNTSTCAFNVTRAPLGFSGFLPPIGGADETGGTFAEPLRTFKLGSTIPVKFAASCGGGPVTTGVHRLQVVKYSDATNSDEPIDASPQDTATTGNQFRLTDGQWHFNLDTQSTGMTKGIWQLVATLSDGSQHWAWIQVK